MRAMLSFVFMALFVSACAVPRTMPPQLAWMGEPEGARSAFVRCAYLVAEKQCGSSNLKNSAVEACMIDILYKYREVKKREDRTKFLVELGCQEDIAKLRDGEL